MSKNAPDYSDAFNLAEADLSQDELEDARIRLEQRKDNQAIVLEKNQKGKATHLGESDQLVVKDSAINRKAFTLKVLAENEAKFHQLFCLLQIKGDSRKKQDLADEALELLFSKYRVVFA